MPATLSTLSIRDVVSATPRAKLVQVELGNRAFEFEPGQAVLVARQGVLPRRPYSIASAPEDAKRGGVIDLLVGTDTVLPDDGMDPVPGALIDVEGPIGSFTFPPAPDQRKFLFVAGGTGIAPLRAMLRHALGMPHERIALFYSARTADEFAFESELRTLADAGAIDLRLTVTREARGGWPGGLGRATAASLGELVDDPETLCFVCGPASMVEDIPKLLQQIGVRPQLIRVENWVEPLNPEP